MFHIHSGALRGSQLKKAARLNPDGVIRLAKFLRLHIEGMKPMQVAKLIRWRIT